MNMRFKLTRKDTGQKFKDWVKKEEQFRTYCLGQGFMVGMNGDGYFFYCNMGRGSDIGPTKFLKKEEWDIWIATEKVNGSWDYKKV